MRTPFSDGPEGRDFPGKQRKAARPSGPSLNRVCLLSILFLMPIGCRPHYTENLPVLIPQDEPAELRFLAHRASLLKNISGSGSLQLTQFSGQGVVFDLAIAMQPPDHARLRAWKMGQAVLDLTVLPDSVWLETSQQGQRKTQITGMGDAASRITRALSFLSGGFFDDPNLAGKDVDDQLILTQQKPGESTITCWVDRRTLSPRRFRMVDSTGAERFSMTLEDYTEFSGTIWPRKVTAISSMGIVVVSLDDVEINGGLPAGAFVPPTSAEKLP